MELAINDVIKFNMKYLRGMLLIYDVGSFYTPPVNSWLSPLKWSKVASIYDDGLQVICLFTLLQAKLWSLLKLNRYLVQSFRAPLLSTITIQRKFFDLIAWEGCHDTYSIIYR